jgi:hypothetical protein
MILKSIELLIHLVTVYFCSQILIVYINGVRQIFMKPNFSKINVSSSTRKTNVLNYQFFLPLAPIWSIGLISQFLDHSQMVGFLGCVISSSQGLYLNTGQHKHRKTHDPGSRASKDSTCFRPLVYRDRQTINTDLEIILYCKETVLRIWVYILILTLFSSSRWFSLFTCNESIRVIPTRPFLP